MPEQSAHAGCQINPDLKIPVFFCRINIADYFNLCRVADAKAIVMGSAMQGRSRQLKPMSFAATESIAT